MSNRFKGITISATYGAPYNEDFGQADPWTVTLRYRRRQMTLPFYMGQALAREPTVEDVMECLLSDASSADQSFEDWCDDYGFDTDSRKAERIYRTVQTQDKKLRRFLGDDYSLIAEMAEIR